MRTTINVSAGMIGGVTADVLTSNFGVALITASACALVAYITQQIAKYVHRKILTRKRKS